MILIGYVLFSTGKIDVLYQKFENFVYNTVEYDPNESQKNVAQEPILQNENTPLDIKIFDEYFLETNKKPDDDSLINHFSRKIATNKITSDRNPLHLMAIDNRPYPIVQLGIRFPQFLNAKDADGICPLSLALLRHSHKAVDAFLMFPNINLKIVDKNGYTVLHYAARSGHYAAAERAIQKGVSPNAKSARGLTPLLIAAQNDNIELVRLMLENGGDPSIKVLGKSRY